MKLTSKLINSAIAMVKFTPKERLLCQIFEIKKGDYLVTRARECLTTHDIMKTKQQKIENIILCVRLLLMALVDLSYQPEATNGTLEKAEPKNRAGSKDTK